MTMMIDTEENVSHLFMPNADNFLVHKLHHCPLVSRLSISEFIDNLVPSKHSLIKLLNPA